GASGYAHAAAARAGVINLTKTLAVEWAPHGILVNGVAPGTIRTSALDQYDRSTLAAAVAALPVKRMGEAIEVARAVAFLASPGGRAAPWLKPLRCRRAARSGSPLWSTRSRARIRSSASSRVTSCDRSATI